MFLTSLSVRRSVLMTMVILVFAVLGAFSYRRLVVDLIPRIDLPFVTVTTIYPGASPEEIETQVTKKIEDAVSNISGIKHITSTSFENVSFVGIEFDMEVDVDFAAIDIKDEIDKIRMDMPDAVEDPTVVKFDINAEPIVNLAISGARPLQEVHELADNQIRDELSKVSGVASIEIVGGRQREILVSLKRERLRAYDLSINEVLQAIAMENLSVPAGHITETWQEYTVRTVGEFANVDDLARMRIRLRSGEMIELRELGQVLDTFEEVRELARFEGKNAVGMSIKKQGDANTVETAVGIRNAIDQLRQHLPRDIQISVAREKASFIEDSVADVIQNILIGVLLTAILLYLFTHSWQATVIAALSVPISLIATFLLIDFAGFTINVMTLMALSVAIGVLVTNALVVIENIINHVERGEESADAAEIGTREIAVAVIASTATNVVVFTPIAFMSGIIGQMFKQFGLTVVFATLFSLLISFTLTPMMAAKLLRKRQEKKGGSPSPLRWFSAAWDRAYNNLADDYRRALSWCLDHRIITVGVVLLSLGFSLYLFGYIGGEFIPQSDQGMLSVEIAMAPGTPLGETDRALHRVERVLRTIPEVETLYSTIGGGNKGVEEAAVLAQLVPRARRDRGVLELINDLRPSLASIPGADIQVVMPGMGPSAE